MPANRGIANVKISEEDFLEQRFLKFFSRPPFSVSHWYAPTNLKIKHKKQNNLFVIILLNGKDATVFWKLVL